MFFYCPILFSCPSPQSQVGKMNVFSLILDKADGAQVDDNIHDRGPAQYALTFAHYVYLSDVIQITT